MLKKGQHVTVKTTPGSRRRIYNGERGVIARVSKYKEEAEAPYIVELTAGRNVFIGFAAGELVAATEERGRLSVGIPHRCE